MRPRLYTLTSSLHGEMAPDPRQEPFIREIEAALGVEFDCRGDDFSDYGPAPSSFAGLTGEPPAPALIYVRTGGTEGLFLKLLGEKLKAGRQRFRVKPGMTQGKDSMKGLAADPPMVRLLASGQSNSLAASMEILSWLQREGFAGEILHGSPAAIAAQILRQSQDDNNVISTKRSAWRDPSTSLGMTEREAQDDRGEDLPCHLDQAQRAERSLDFALENRMIEPLTPGTFGRPLKGKRFGVIGRPSDWLISSGVDYAAARHILGAELIDIPIEELVDEVRSLGQASPVTSLKPLNTEILRQAQDDKGEKAQDDRRLKPLNTPRYGRPISEKDWNGAQDIYKALQRLVHRYRLDGLTLRCFDLLTTLHNTGCLALAILNSEGITATCEGDIPAMLSMAVARKLTDSASFQVNLSRIEGDRLLFAHCTVPLSIVRNYCYDTHFESGIGVAIHGELPEGPVTLFKIAPDLGHLFRQPAKLVANPYGDNLCRTQVLVEAPGAAEYFLKKPLGNHHILVPGTL